MIRFDNCIYPPAPNNHTGTKAKEMKGVDVLTSCLWVMTVISNDCKCVWDGRQQEEVSWTKVSWATLHWELKMDWWTRGKAKTQSQYFTALPYLRCNLSSQPCKLDCCVFQMPIVSELVEKNIHPTWKTWSHTACCLCALIVPSATAGIGVWIALVLIKH